MKTLVSLMLVTMTTWAVAQMTVTFRTDFTDNISESIIAIDKSGWELWDIGLNTKTPMYRLGYLAQVSPNLRLGGYLVYKEPNWFTGPALAYTDKVGNGKLLLYADTYLPLNSGPCALSIPEVRCLWPLNKNVEIGPAIHFWAQEHKPVPVHYGMGFKTKINEANNIYMRWCPLGAPPDTLRVQWSLTF